MCDLFLFQIGGRIHPSIICAKRWVLGSIGQWPNQLGSKVSKDQVECILGLNKDRMALFLCGDCAPTWESTLVHQDIRYNL